MQLTRTFGVMTVAAAVALLAACGSSGSSAGGTNSSTPPTKSPIAIGMDGSFSGAVAATANGVKAGVDAWVKDTNAQGGLGGHPIKLYTLDDGTNPSTGLTNARKLIEQDHVVAFLGEASGAVSAWESYVQSQGVPVIGGESEETPFITNPDFFGTGANAVALIYGQLALAKEHGTKVGFLYCAELPICAQSLTLFKALGSAQGLSIPVGTAVSASAVDYTAQCQAMKSAGVQSYSVTAASPTVLRVAGACKAQGLTAALVSSDGSITQDWLTNPAVDGVGIAGVDFPYTDDSAPASKAFQQAIKTYEPNVGALFGPNVAYGWIAGQVFAKAVTAAGAAAVTPTTVKQGLYSFRGETLGGLTPPLTFVAKKVNLINCYFVSGIQSGKIATPQGLKTTCAPDPLVSAIASKL
jgi:branched-chain amino acid transport system substrate-binding protein